MRDVSPTSGHRQQFHETERIGRFDTCVSTDGSRRFSVATYHDLDEFAADGQAFGRLVGDARLMIFFIAPWVDEPRALELLTVPEGVHSIGCTASGLVTTSGEFGAALQVVLLGGPGFGAVTAAAEYDDLGWRSAGALVGRSALVTPAHTYQALLLLTDGLAGDVAEMLRGAYSSTGAGLSIVGGCAGDDLAMCSTRQFVGARVIDEGVVAAALSSSAPLGIGVSHGWKPIGEPMLVTSSSGTSVLALDDQPAMDAYLDVVAQGTERPRFSDGAEFARFAQTRPLGIRDDRSGEVRFVTGGDLDRRALDFLVHIPEGQLVWVMAGDRRSVLDATAEAVAQAIDGLAGCPPIGVIAFDCVARRSVVGDDRAGDEAEVLVESLPVDLPFAGFYTYGEIARSGGSLGLHHQTMVVLAVG